jgi:hypothetical protein
VPISFIREFPAEIASVEVDASKEVGCRKSDVLTFQSYAGGFYDRPRGVGSFSPMHPASAAAICDPCGREIAADRAEHYRGHLENAQAYLELVEKRGGDSSWSATAREWIERCGRPFCRHGAPL